MSNFAERRIYWLLSIHATISDLDHISRLRQHWWWLIPRRRGLLGRLMVNIFVLVGGCRDRFLMRTPYRTLDSRRFGMRRVGMLVALSASCVFPLLLYASLPRTYDWLFSLMSAICLGLGLLLPWLIANSRLCKLSIHLIFVALSWSATVSPSFLERTGEDCFGHAYVFHPCECCQPSAAVPEARRTLFWAGCLSWVFLRLTRILAIWCQGWNVSSVGDTAPVARFASDRDPRSLHRTGG